MSDVTTFIACPNFLILVVFVVIVAVGIDPTISGSMAIPLTFFTLRCTLPCVVVIALGAQSLPLVFILSFRISVVFLIHQVIDQLDNKIKSLGSCRHDISMNVIDTCQSLRFHQQEIWCTSRLVLGNAGCKLQHRFP
ncbi:hypothetical protein Tco_1421645 [Tanacetum coccineum]